MTERFQIFKRTEEEIGKRLGNIESLLQTNTEELGGLDMDGDMTDDPILHQLKGGRENLLEEKNILLGYLRISSDYIGQSGVNNSNGVQKGHLVHIQVEYPDKYKEEIEVTIGSKLDSDFLGKLGVISDETPLGKALLGRKEGDKVIYQAPSGKGSATILKISTSTFV